MFILRIEHPVPDYDAWKRTFDSDPLDRKGSGVRRYRVQQPADDANYVIVDLEFESREQAAAMQAALYRLWGRVQQEGLIGRQQARVIELLEATDIGP
jgi:hypothetical protein